MAHRRPEPSVAFHTRCASGRRLSPLRSARRAVPTWDVRVNLYAGLPPVMSGSGGLTGSIIGHFSTMFSPGRPVLMAHMMLVATWVLTLVVATSLGDRFAIGWSATGLVTLLVAGYAGISFSMFGHDNVDSCLMAVGFLVTFAAYLVAAIRNSASGLPSMRTRQARAVG